MKRITLFISCLFLVISLKPNIYKVTPTGSGNQDGSSWSNAMPITAVESTIRSAPASDSEFWLSQGTYTSKVFDYNNAVAQVPVCKIYGGFAGDNDAETVETRNWKNNVTILDGGGAIQAIKYVPGGTAFPHDGKVVIDGVTFYRNCDLTKDYAMTVTFKGSLTISNCIFYECQAKRGVIQWNSNVPGVQGTVTIVNCLFYNNTITGIATNPSSAIIQIANSTGNIVNCTMADNIISSPSQNVALGIISGMGNSTLNVVNNIIYNHTGVTDYSVSKIEGLSTAQVDNVFYSKNNASDLSMAGSDNTVLLSTPFVDGSYAIDTTGGSVCVDMGDNTSYLPAYPLKDLAVNDRILNGRIDLGAYESSIPTGVRTVDTSSVYAYRNKSKIYVKSESGELIQVYTLQGIKVAEIIAKSNLTVFDLSFLDVDKVVLKIPNTSFVL